jgi:DNA polymerase I-like protein with 3'-5' exonuclease and polymerase domains
VRELFIAIPGHKLVGVDAKGLELRMMSHYLFRYDNGAYAKIVVEGDPHLFHQGLAELETKDDAKTFIYGWLYGAGDAKIGLIVHKGQTAGKALRLKFLKRFPALNSLKTAVSSKATMHGSINGLDGRRLTCRAVYSSLNTLLQSAGALVMKMAVIFFNREIRKRGWYQDGTVRQVAFVHDEIQAIAKEGFEDECKQIGIQAIRDAGMYFGLRVPTDGDGKVGSNWGETH